MASAASAEQIQPVTPIGDDNDPIIIDDSDDDLEIAGCVYPSILPEQENSQKSSSRSYIPRLGSTCTDLVIRVPDGHQWSAIACENNVLPQKHPQPRNIQKESPIMPDTGHRIAMMQSHTTQLSRSSHYPSPMSSRSSVVSKSTDLLRSVEPNVTGNHGSACSEITHGKFNPSSFIVTHNNSENRVLVSLNDEDEETGDVELSTVCRGMSSTSTDEQQLIEIDDDNEEDESTVRSSDSEDKSPRGVFARARRQSSILRYLPRNYPIIQPLVQLEKFDHMGVSLRQGKSVELTDGDFLRIQSIVLHSGNSSVTLRGHRLQRCSSMNGMLERKLNELCLFYEIDIDDPRPVLQQSVFEVSVLQIKKLRNIRWTNQKFPGDRNVKTTDYHNQEKVQNEGGLTVRWKYTVKYASSADRHRNNYQERTLERLTEEELYMPAVKLDALRRFEWRGDTIPGGAFQPHLVAENVVPSAMLRDESGIEVSKCTTDLMAPSVDARRSAGLVELYHRKRKRIVAHTEELRTGATKRMQHEEDKLNDTADGVKRIRLIENSLSGSNLPLIIDLDPEPPTADFQPFINMPSRLLSTPLPLPLSGSIRSQPRSTNTPRPRSDGQMLTYGDAFCGAGGSTRGAAMAGLQVKWGFDFSKHACATWRANFPKAVCYDMASHQFVQIAQRAARKGFPHVMKVDILHLSPPCQYFSFAHSTAGKDDEMNTASLFAVREVIGVAKPRIATLEQTFGITRPKFMGYLAALIQMFTSLDFSVRWAVVRLARWGLPQSRRRLIVIAACPGEILPHIPASTHSDNPGENLLPFATINQTISQIPMGTPDHDAESILFKPSRGREQPYDGDAILPRAMTCSGGQNWHPSGWRDFTIREYASLQGFPPNHVFRGSYVKKQIGNAVPPCVGKVLFENIKKELYVADGILEGLEAMVLD